MRAGGRRRGRIAIRATGRKVTTRPRMARPSQPSLATDSGSFERIPSSGDRLDLYSVLLLQHRPALVAHEEIVHVVGVLLLLREDTLQQHPSRRIPVAEVAHHLAVALDGDTLGDEVFLDHVYQVLALGILRGGSGADALGVRVRLAAELIDPLREEIEMLLFLLGVL